MRTVQGDLEAALARVLSTEVETHCAGRTDAGVHALGQVVSIPNAPDITDPVTVKGALNAILAPAIAIRSLVPVPEDFHARFSARSRTYVYAVLTSAEPDPFLALTTLHHPTPLDLDAMNEAAGHLAGSHDFSSFGRVVEGTPPERNLFELRAGREEALVRIRARANAFIRQMVRSIVGTLLQVGEARRSPEQMPEILGAHDRSAAGPVAPPHGLCLVAVEYDQGWSHTA